MAVVGAVGRGPAGSLPRKSTLVEDVYSSLSGPAPRPRFWGADTDLPPPRALLLAFPTLVVSSGLGVGEEESPARSSQLSKAFCVLHSPSSDFHPTASSRERCA